MRRELAVEAHTIWAKWVASMLGKNLESALLNDSNLTSNRPLTAWQETVVNQVKIQSHSFILLSFLPSSINLAQIFALSKKEKGARSYSARILAIDV